MHHAKPPSSIFCLPGETTPQEFPPSFFLCALAPLRDFNFFCPSHLLLF
jgi:hypothetical protein